MESAFGITNCLFAECVYYVFEQRQILQVNTGEYNGV